MPQSILSDMITIQPAQYPSNKDNNTNYKESLCKQSCNKLFRITCVNLAEDQDQNEGELVVLVALEFDPFSHRRNQHLGNINTTI